MIARSVISDMKEHDLDIERHFDVWSWHPQITNYTAVPAWGDAGAIAPSGAVVTTPLGRGEAAAENEIIRQFRVGQRLLESAIRAAISRVAVAARGGTANREAMATELQSVWRQLQFTNSFVDAFRVFDLDLQRRGTNDDEFMYDHIIKKLKTETG